MPPNFAEFPPERKAEIINQLRGVMDNDLLENLPFHVLCQIIIAHTGYDPNAPKNANKNKDGNQKKAVNGFMAFRTYYLKIFGPAEQKTLSSALTKFWGEDPRSDHWSLIAKTYSFVRDTARARTHLDAFLAIAAPIFHLPDPKSYLAKAFWTSVTDENGNTEYVYDEAAAKAFQATYVEPDDLPKTPYKLLQVCLASGYQVPNTDGNFLLEEMVALGDTELTGPRVNNLMVANFMNRIVASPVEAASAILEVPITSDMLELGVNVFRVENAHNFAELPIYAHNNAFTFYGPGEAVHNFNDDEADAPRLDNLLNALGPQRATRWDGEQEDDPQLYEYGFSNAGLLRPENPLMYFPEVPNDQFDVQHDNDPYYQLTNPFHVEALTGYGPIMNPFGDIPEPEAPLYDPADQFSFLF